MEKTVIKIMKILEDNARCSNEDIAELLNMKESEVSNIISGLEDSGVIVKYTTIINNETPGNDYVDAIIQLGVTPQKRSGFDAIAEEIMAFDMVKNLYLMSGSHDLTLMIEGKTVREISLFVSESLSAIDSVVSTKTHFILKQYKSSGVPIVSKITDKRELIR